MLGPANVVRAEGLSHLALCTIRGKDEALGFARL